MAHSGCEKFQRFHSPFGMGSVATQSNCMGIDDLVVTTHPMFKTLDFLATLAAHSAAKFLG
jgi:hypothetical protein